MSKSWNSKLGWNNDNYIINVLDATFGPAKKGSPMVTFEFEIVSPATVNLQVDGQPTEVTVAGAKFKHYMTTQSLLNGVVDTDKTAKLAERCEATCKAFGVDYSTFNPENVDTAAFVGKKVWAFLEHDVQEQRKSPTPEQIAAKQLGDIATNPLTGEKLQNFYPRIKEFFGLAQ